MTAVHFDPKATDEERRSSLYNGDLVILSPTPASLKLIQVARNMLEEAFHPHDPREIQSYKSAEDVAQILSVLKPNFIHLPECKAIISEMMAEHGIELEKLFFDVPRLRSAYPADFLSTGIAYAFHPHRDTWYSAPSCQLNWWIPVYPIESTNALGFYPEYFAEPVKNNSEIYNYYEWNAKNRATAAKHVKKDTREQPKPQQNFENESVRYLTKPGGAVIFSGAHLHESVPNTSGLARYSIDFRTVHLDDVIAKRGAPNVDSRCTGTTLRDYLRATDYAHLPDETVALYDDPSAQSNEILYFGDRLSQDSA